MSNRRGGREDGDIVAEWRAPGWTELRARTRAGHKAAVRRQLFLLLGVGDLLAIAGGMVAASTFRTNEAFSPQTINVLLVLLPAFVLTALNNRAYGVAALELWAVGVRRSILSLTMAAFFVFGLGFAFKVSSEYSRIAIVTGFSISAILLIVGRLGVRYVVRWAMVGGLYEEIVLRDDPLAIVKDDAKIVDARALGLEPVLNSPTMLDRIGKALVTADRVIVVCPLERRQAWTGALKGLGINVEVMLPEAEQLGLLATASYDDRITAVVARGPLGARDELAKRGFDLLVVLFLAPAVVLIGGIAALAIKLEDGGPILFRQSRIGRGNRLFHLYKFRSMRTAQSDADGTVSTRRDDDRITRVGRLLRSTSIDELPQLYNVLKGDMSIVGPRPHAVGSTAADALFWEIDDRYWLRHAAKPGLTGLAQVRGFRGATSTAADLTNRVQADLEYLSGWTLRRDLRILAATVTVLLHPNAY